MPNIDEICTAYTIDILSEKYEKMQYNENTFNTSAEDRRREESRNRKLNERRTFPQKRSRVRTAPGFPRIDLLRKKGRN